MSIVEEAQTETAQPGWFNDPLGRHHLRYHDGTEWTDHVTHFGPTPCEGCAGQAASGQTGC